MKALIVGATANVCNGISMINGLSNKGIEPGYIGYRSYIRKYGLESFKTQLLSTLKEHKPEWVFCQYQYNPIIPPEFFQEIKNANPGTRLSLMSVDMRNDLDKSTIAAGKFADICFQKGRVEPYRKMGLNCAVLQEGYSDLLFHKKDCEKKYDVIFAGGFYPNSKFPGTGERVSTISYLSRIVDLKVIGSGWDRVLPGHCLLGYVDLSKINNYYNMSKIVLNINHYNDIEHYWSIRMIEGLASGSLMVTKYVPGLENYFENHHDIVWFYSLADCIEIIKHYLNHAGDRERVISNGLKSVADFRWESIMCQAHEKIFSVG